MKTRPVTQTNCDSLLWWCLSMRCTASTCANGSMFQSTSLHHHSCVQVRACQSRWQHTHLGWLKWPKTWVVYTHTTQPSLFMPHVICCHVMCTCCNVLQVVCEVCLHHMAEHSTSHKQEILCSAMFCCIAHVYISTRNFLCQVWHSCMQVGEEVWCVIVNVLQWGPEWQLSDMGSLVKRMALGAGSWTLGYGGEMRQLRQCDGELWRTVFIQAHVQVFGRAQRWRAAEVVLYMQVLSVAMGRIGGTYTCYNKW